MFFICRHKKGNMETPKNVKSSGKIIFFFSLLLVLANPGIAAWAQEYGGGPIVFIKPVRAVIFEHKFHLGQKFTCLSCHPEPFPKNAGEIEKKDDFTMAAFNQGKYCGKCHNGTLAFSVNTRCNWCHIGVQGHKHLEEYELGLK
jgi:c(7)-type cytochrome triheme protein